MHAPLLVSSEAVGELVICAVKAIVQCTIGLRNGRVETC
jgi:hypothetical protein